LDVLCSSESTSRAFLIVREVGAAGKDLRQVVDGLFLILMTYMNLDAGAKPASTDDRRYAPIL
jgi:hypothetical protein